MIGKNPFPNIFGDDCASLCVTSMVSSPFPFLQVLHPTPPLLLLISTQNLSHMFDLEPSTHFQNIFETSVPLFLKFLW